MLKQLFRNFLTKIPTEQHKNSLVIEYGQLAIDVFWSNESENIKNFSSGMIKSQAEEMMGEVIKIASSPDPRMANRNIFSEYLFQYAKFQALIIEPPPADDPTGLRGQPGISGELRSHLLELSQKSESLKEFISSFSTPNDWNGVWTPVFLRYRIAFSRAHVFNALRYQLDDGDRESENDWFLPCLAATCAWHEHQYRKCLGMPPSLDDSGTGAELRAITLSDYIKCVESGVRFPDIEWKKRKHWVETGNGDIFA